MNRALRRQQQRSAKRTATAGNLPAVDAFRAAGLARSTDALAEAEALYQRCLAADPRHTAARNDLGLLLLQRGQIDAAKAQFNHVLQREPANGLALLNLSLAHADAGEIAEACAVAERAIAAAPRLSASHAALAHALSLSGKTDRAADTFRQALALDPAAMGARRRAMALLIRMGRLSEALAHGDHLVATRPDDPEAYAERATVWVAMGRFETATADLRTALARQPDDRGALRRLWTHLDQHGMQNSARAELDALIVKAPDRPVLYVERAAWHRGRRDLPAALNDLQKAAALDPADARYPFEIGEILFAGAHYKPAVAAFLVAASLKPAWSDVYYNLASIRLIENDVQTALALIRHAAALAPDSLQTAVLLCWLRLRVCDWAGIEQAFRDAMDRSLKAGTPFAPFALMAFGLPPDELHLWVRAWAERVAPPRPDVLVDHATALAPPAGRRLRIGYLSADYKSHATATLVAELFGLHDRGRFETIGYNIGSVDDSILASRMVRALDGFVDLTLLGDEEAARRIAEDRLDILVDLKGYTTESRPGILTYRPAPIQVNFLGYPGSMGTPLIDYVIADAIVAPFEHGSCFDEAIAQLPHCYQPNDRARPGADPRARRADHGLPESGTVFCCFNNIYKVTPLVFDLWTRVLHAVPGSVLWLLDSIPETHVNLRREAVQRGIAADRLIFADRVSFTDHMARMGLADLFLDTLPVNAHTTASEALWAGLPVLTCLGPTFAGRVAASLLTAVGLPELIVPDLEAYERTAIDLARDPGRIAALRQHLLDARTSAPLFDTPGYARHYEAALTQMVARRAEGRAPSLFRGRSGGRHHPRGSGYRARAPARRPVLPCAPGQARSVHRAPVRRVGRARRPADPPLARTRSHHPASGRKDTPCPSRRPSM